MAQWRAIPGWEGRYEISSLGQVRSLTRTLFTARGPRLISGRSLKPDTSGPYERVTLCRDGLTVRESVHVLVAAAFLGVRPDGLEVCHSDGDSANNAASNLRYDTRSANAFDRVTHGTNRNARKTHCPQGHEYMEGNIYWRKRSGGRTSRRCRACHLKGGRSASH